MRIAIVDPNKCKPNQCKFECHTYCPVVRAGKPETVIKRESDGKSQIDEVLCIGCGICPKRCPFDAIDIINLPAQKELPVHQYGINSFRIFNFINPRKEVIGILGRNGIGKSTIIKILSNQIKPNLGDLTKEANDKQIIDLFKGSEAQTYFTQLYNNKLKFSYKPQYVNQIPKLFKGTVKDLLKKLEKSTKYEEVIKHFELKKILNRKIKDISGGELQRLSIAATILKEADYYFFDEPTSYLDIKQRLNIAKQINKLNKEQKGVFVIEHDLIVLDYLTNFVHVLYGEPGVYGVISKNMSTKEGINQYLSGFLKTENVRFRNKPINFLESKKTKTQTRKTTLKWEDQEIKAGEFKLKIDQGQIYEEEVIGILGENGTGKTTFFKHLAKKYGDVELKRQELIDSEENVLAYLSTCDKNKAYTKAIADLEIHRIYNNNLDELSGGELQQVMITKVLGTSKSILLFDEPTAFLDVEQRMKVARLLKEAVKTFGKQIFVIDHDLLFLAYLSDKVILFNGEPSVKANSTKPLEVETGFNQFLQNMQITFRRDPQTGRPRANKENSVLDKEQKKSKKYFQM